MSAAVDFYRLPERGEHCINFSGGRSSGFLMWHILQAHGGALPGNARAVFCNTGKEREETLEFVREVSERWSVPVTWLEYEHRPEARGGMKDPKHCHRVVDFNTASRRGEPFEALIRAKNMLPNPAMRFCTTELKIRTTERWLRRDLGITAARSILGIRHDEPRRWSQAMLKDCGADYPMVMAGHGLADVMGFWAASSFDLGIHSDLGNCDLCFLKGKAKIVRLLKDDPGRGRWWERMEGLPGTMPERRSGPATFKKLYSYADLAEIAASTLDLFGEPEDEQAISCFCGD